MWHMHQPDYRDMRTGRVHLPWTYLHATKDYVDMAAHLEAVPEARAVVNFAPILLEQKLELSAGKPLIFPHANATMGDAIRRAGFAHVTDLDGLETHDCFSVTEYMAIDHSGLTAPGESWKAIEEGRITRDGDFPINPSGGLIGLGHPVGATGVRMVLDCARQVTGRAGGYQLPKAENMLTFNVGGSTTTCASFVVGVG